MRDCETGSQWMERRKGRGKIKKGKEQQRERTTIEGSKRLFTVTEREK